MNSAKKITTLAIAFCLCIWLSACGRSTGEAGGSDKNISQRETLEIENGLMD